MNSVPRIRRCISRRRAPLEIDPNPPVQFHSRLSDLPRYLAAGRGRIARGSAREREKMKRKSSTERRPFATKMLIEALPQLLLEILSKIYVSVFKELISYL
ncbi:hypothetical protein PUN28_010164 [Cardiocondyla obscurior]|uniref:Uncharacterized protein n=1 Tax=Cardiocondyla obscurior TaxID=286306 RepID=A0AAW2FTC2_9HYME